MAFTQAESDALLPFLQKLPEACQVAIIRHLYRVEDGASVRDSAIAMLMEIGATREEAFASVDTALAGMPQ